MNKSIVFIAPAVDRRVNPKHFVGYTPGGEGGGVNYDAFPDFSRHSFENAQCVPLVAITAPGQPDWGTKWKLAPAFELEMRSQMHRVVRILEENPLSAKEYERLQDLAAMGPLTRKRLDDRIERLGLVEEYDPELDYSAVECAELFYFQAYGQYINLPYDGQIKLPYVDVHDNLCYVTQHTAVEKINQVLRPELVKEWLQRLEPESIIGRTSKCSGCPLATYIHSRLRMDVQVGNVFDLSSFSYEGVMHDLPEWAWGYASAIDEETISFLDKENHAGADDEDLYPDYPSVPVKAKHALKILEPCLELGFDSNV
jgi:hypothetical protein